MLTFCLSAGSLPLAAGGAAAACVLVLAVGALLHRPLSRVPENTLKYGVGVLMSTFGTFWAVEGLGVFAPGGESFSWPGGEIAIVVVLVVWVVVSRALVSLLQIPAATAPAATA